MRGGCHHVRKILRALPTKLQTVISAVFFVVSVQVPAKIKTSRLFLIRIFILAANVIEKIIFGICVTNAWGLTGDGKRNILFEVTARRQEAGFVA